MPLDITDAATGIVHVDKSLAQGPDGFHQEGAAAHEVELPPVYDGKGTLTTDMIGTDFPTEEEIHKLRRVAAKIPFRVYTVAFVELCERFSYYGTTVIYTNFIQQPLPPGSTAGNVIDAANNPDNVAGALNMGQHASTGIGTFNQFWSYVTPLIGAYLADKYFGRFRTIGYALVLAIIGHVLLVSSAAPSLLSTNSQGSLGLFIIGMLIMGTGTGGFKPNISPLIAEQIPNERMKIITLKSGERVIVDPAVTNSRIYHYFYLFVNIGALIGQIGMSYSERFVGFWLAYLLPTLLLLLCPAVLFSCRNMYTRTPPAGSVFSKSMRLFFLANKGRWSVSPVTTWKRLHDGTFWENVKPSKFSEETRPKWMTFDDAWVDEVGRGFAACSVFCYLPLYWLTYNQLNNNLTSQAAVMTLNGIPNDVLSNLDPFALIILIPIFDLALYPFLRKMHINLSPIKKIALGFLFGAAAMVWAAVIQQYIYWKSPCGYEAASCEDADGNNINVDINVWAQTGSYILIAISEIFASITSLEYAFSKAPKNMRSLVMSVSLVMVAFSAALQEAFVVLSADPLLVWNYGVFAVLSFIGGTMFWIQYRQLDRDEDRLNNLPTGHLGTKQDALDIERGRASSTEESEKDVKGVEN